MRALPAPVGSPTPGSPEPSGGSARERCGQAVVCPDVCADRSTAERRRRGASGASSPVARAAQAIAPLAGTVPVRRGGPDPRAGTAAGQRGGGARRSRGAGPAVRSPSRCRPVLALRPARGVDAAPNRSKDITMPASCPSRRATADRRHEGSANRILGTHTLPRRVNTPTRRTRT